jgi:hypothetical protein
MFRCINIYETLMAVRNMLLPYLSGLMHQPNERLSV